MHFLFRYVQGLFGPLATFMELCESMNKKSAIPIENCPTLSLSQYQLTKWFKQNGGKERSLIEKPKLTEEHMKQQKVWACKYFDLLSNPNQPVAFLDKKWFYTTSWRRRMKKLPKGDHEEHEPTYVQPKICSRCYPVKVMYLGVVACPNPEHDFDGRVFLKHISNREPAQRTSRNKKFSVDIDVNKEIKNAH